jgi:hypothetical protein
MPKQYIYGLCNPGTNEPLYVGRSKSATDRQRGHVQLSHGDYTPKGIWIKYLQKVDKWPDMIVLEQQTFAHESDAEKWGKEQEKVWIQRLFNEGVFIFNHGSWWKHPDRKQIPAGVREAWARLHETYFRLDWWLRDSSDLYIEITRFIAFRGIRALIEQYPALEVAPVSWIEPPESTDPIEAFEYDADKSADEFPN